LIGNETAEITTEKFADLQLLFGGKWAIEFADVGKTDVDQRGNLRESWKH
jgi:hypothetical protein